ncbi:MAG TPA: MdtA/MuxA family multidrug efflux RND transporter periplasmic adaptor subunit [Opitutaceae bacterium]|nr:MdtA/MuxA family multidrug efflux RND transporter periplasmic adaptor subunit [Opitutaceae bacterium]
MTTLPPTTHKRRFSWAWVIAALLVVAIAVIWVANHTGEAAQRQEMRQARGGRRGGGGGMFGPLPVVVQPAAKGDIHIYLNGLGTITPLANITVRTQVSGLLVQVAFKEGQEVNKGELLAVVDPRPYQVALEQAQGQLMQAQSQLKEAEADLERYTTLSQQDSIAKQQVDSQQALVNQDKGLVQTDQAAIDSAKLNLAYCHITAPVAGRVGLRQVDAGNYVTPGDASGIVVLTEVKPITAIFTLPEDDVPEVSARLRSGTPIPVDAYDRTQTHKLASGTLTTFDNQVDPSTGTFKLRATFANDDESLFPNQFVNTRMLLDTIRDATIIPTSAVERGENNGAYVYLVQQDNTVTARDITLGQTEGERVAVTAGLNVGDRVVVDGADRLKEGMEVVPQESGANPPPAPATAPAAAGRQRRRRPGGGEGGAAGTAGPGGAGGSRPASPGGPQQ